MKFPFSTYDFFGYLACGFLLVCAAEFAFDGKWLLFANPTPAIPLLAFWFGIAYVTGHLVASISSFLIEHTLVLSCPTVRIGCLPTQPRPCGPQSP